MSSVWTITCPKCGDRETYHTPMAMGDGEIRMARSRAETPCPKCRAPRRQLQGDSPPPTLEDSR